MINFGIKNAEEIPHLGTNAKMNEFEAAMGLCVLDDMDIIFSSRKAIAERYKLKLQDLVQFQEFNHNAEEIIVTFLYCLNPKKSCWVFKDL